MSQPLLTQPSRHRIPEYAPAPELAAFRRAARRLAGYRDLLDDHGITPGDVTSFSEVPYLDKETVFGDGVARWIEGGHISAAAELLTSSGTSGAAFSIGVTSKAEQAALSDIADHALRQLGASETSPTLLVNCLPMGIAVPTTLATVASSSS
jgi:phenylacetate-CoA ligase